jgi:hypothetical protein
LSKDVNELTGVEKRTLLLAFLMAAHRNRAIGNSVTQSITFVFYSAAFKLEEGLPLAQSDIRMAKDDLIFTIYKFPCGRIREKAHSFYKAQGIR